VREQILVIKFGGRSLGSAVRIRAAVARVRFHRSRGRGVVVVVSAAGATTDRILRRLADVGGKVPTARFQREAERERDRALATGEDRAGAILAAALLAAGIPARSLRGGEAGLRVRGAPADPEVDPGPVRALLAEGITPVVSGFQAPREDGETATLGRGGSDLTAVALAGALGPAACHLVKDVDGVFDRDPAGGPGAVLLSTLGQEELLALASKGARVIQAGAALRAVMDRVPLRIYHYASHPGACGGSRVDFPNRAPDRHTPSRRAREGVV
jgi:aspartate kinase